MKNRNERRIEVKDLLNRWCNEYDMMQVGLAPTRAKIAAQIAGLNSGDFPLRFRARFTTNFGSANPPRSRTAW